MTSLHFYFFSPDGRVYRTFDPPALPGNDVRRLDFDALERTDPENTGRYGVQGNQLVVMMGGPQPQRLTTSVPRGGGPRLVIESIVYVKQ